MQVQSSSVRNRRPSCRTASTSAYENLLVTSPEPDASMPQRRFLIASSLARLIRKQQGVVGQVVEGYFPAHPNRDLFVSLEPDACYLVLTPTREDARPEQ